LPGQFGFCIAHKKFKAVGSSQTAEGSKKL
jgi:hypothetical protein